MKVDTNSLKNFHNSLRDDWLPPLRGMCSTLWEFAETDGLWGNTDKTAGGRANAAHDLSAAWRTAMDWRHSEARNCVDEMEALYSAVHQVGLDYKAVDEDNADGLYQHA